MQLCAQKPRLAIAVEWQRQSAKAHTNPIDDTRDHATRVVGAERRPHDMPNTVLRAYFP